MATKRRRGETSNPSQKEKEIQVMIDPDLLDCSICCHPLHSPVNQCENGHVACSSCWSKLEHKCHICNVPAVTRNIVLDKILESVHVVCTYAHLGCCKNVSYSQMQLHTDTCQFGPSLCSIPGCSHKAFSGEWRGHFLKDHWNPVLQYSDAGSCYSYGESCHVEFDKTDLYYTLPGPGKDMFLVVKEPILNVGNVISLFYIYLSGRSQHIFTYELQVGSKFYKSQVHSIKEWKRGEVCSSSLLVPAFSGTIKVRYVIYKNKFMQSE